MTSHQENDPIGGLSVGLDNLPSPPFVAMEIMRLTQDPDSSAVELADVLSQDPVLATRILQIANSATYGLAREVTSIDRATAMLGLKAVKMMALSFSLAADVGGDGGALSIDTYWYHSLFNAVTARRWAEVMHPGLAEEAFLSGLLSHLGRLVLAQEKHADYAQLIETAGPWPSHEAEAEAFGCSSAEVTTYLLGEWGLPSIIVEATGAMYTRRAVDTEVNGAECLARVLHRVQLTERALAVDGNPEDIEALRVAIAEEGVDDMEVDAFVVDLEARVREVAEMLEVSVAHGVSHQNLIDQARGRLVQVSLEAAQDLAVAKREAEDLRVSNDRLEVVAFEDRLTSVPNRAAFDDHLERVVAGAVRSGGRSVGVIIFDIDHFKSFNDTYGHQAGDEVLRAVAQAMNRVVRGDEMFARYGGEEFVLVARDCVIEDMGVTGERLRQAVEETVVQTHAGPLRVTISGGAAVGMAHDRDAGTRLLKLADEALYRAKEEGRNRISLAR